MIVKRISSFAVRHLRGLTPGVASALTFTAGIILLVSGATPAIWGRLRWLSEFVPLPVLELSHFTGSIVGIALVFLARGMRQRLDVAYHFTVIALAVGAGASLLKGADYEEALLLGLVLATIVPARGQFYRRAALTAEPLTRGWIAAMALVVLGTLWLGLFSYKHVAYSNDLWWRFAVRADAPRFLRAQVGVSVVALMIALARLVRPARVVTARPSEAELERIEPVVRQALTATANLAFTGDKALLFHERSNAFLMYAVSGRSWVALGDPVGSPSEQRDLALRFRETARRNGGWPVFYEVGAASLPMYRELGLKFRKLGEEARVPLAGFALEAPERKKLRRDAREAERVGCTFEMVRPGEADALLPELRRVSDAWLTLKRTREKGFSLGFFDAQYVRRFPLAVVRKGGEVVAFANVLTSARREELSVDLMRHAPGAPNGVMDFLLAKLMQWAAREGFQWFALGMAPLSGFMPGEQSPIWSRVGALVYRHGERFYNFRGLRRYKEKFQPVWEPRYLAGPSGFALPRVLTNVTTLVAGSVAGVVRK